MVRRYQLLCLGLVLITVSGEFFGWEDYIQEWRREEPYKSTRMYPYKEKYGDTPATQSDRRVGLDPEIQFLIPYFGKLYKSIFISVHGAIVLDENKPAASYPSYEYIPRFPNEHYPDQPDYPVIAPYYSEHDFRVNKQDEPSNLFYRVLDPGRASTDSERYIMKGMLDEISVEIRASVVGTNDFFATHGVIITWDQVSFGAADCQNSPQDTCKRNTYQTAILTDGQKTHVVYNYFHMLWIGGAGYQKCDHYTGTRTGSAPDCRSAHVGFNAGHGRMFRPLPDSFTDEIVNIYQKGGSNVTGRYFYQVSANKPLRGGCTNDTTLGLDIWPMEAYPLFGGMFGGKEVNVSGPCFTSGDLVKCRFGDDEVNGHYDGNLMRASCVQPKLDVVGAIKLGLSNDGGLSYRYEVDYIVVAMDRMESGIAITNDDHDWLNPTSLYLRWDPLDINAREGDFVDVHLYGYREYGDRNHLEARWVLLHTFAEDLRGDGYYTVVPDNHRCGDMCEPAYCRDYEVGAFRVAEATIVSNNPRSVWSHMIPVAWFTKDALRDSHGSDWPEKKCEEWYLDDSKSSQWRDALQPCPCRLEQAHVDISRFQLDAYCYSGSDNQYNCEHHKNAKQCFWSSFATVQEGSGSQCCYDNNGELMYSEDSTSGSTPGRYHPRGRAPFGEPPRVPTVSHWVHDLLAFYHCCEWQNTDKDCFSKYMVLRPTKECVNYRQPGQAIAFGDPHFATFDGAFFTFNGLGEFWLLMVEDAQVPEQTATVHIQIRLEQPDVPSLSDVKATVITAVGIQEDNKPLLNFELNYKEAEQKLLGYIDGNLLDFNSPDLHWYDLSDYVIINHDPLGSAAATNFTVILHSGVAVQIAYKNGLMHILTAVPPEFYTLTRGLFGLWNGEPGDDLQPREEGSGAIPPDNTEAVHHNFGLTWLVLSSESMFEHLYREKKNYDYYKRTDFIPHYDPQLRHNSSVTEGQVQAVCSGDKACTYDYMSLEQENIARDNLDLQAWHKEMQTLSTLVVTCGPLNVPGSIKQEPFDYYVGSTVTITDCREGMKLSGHTTYTCRDSGNGNAYWDPEINAECRPEDEVLGTAMIIGIGVTSFIVLVISIVGIVFLCFYCRKKRKEKEEERLQSKPVMYDKDVVTADVDYPTPTLSMGMKKPPRPDASFTEEEEMDELERIKQQYRAQISTDPSPTQRRRSSSKKVSETRYVARPYSDEWDDVEMTPPTDRESPYDVIYMKGDSSTEQTPDLMRRSVEELSRTHRYNNYSSTSGAESEKAIKEANMANMLSEISKQQKKKSHKKKQSKPSEQPPIEMSPTSTHVTTSGATRGTDTMASHGSSHASSYYNRKYRQHQYRMT